MKPELAPILNFVTGATHPEYLQMMEQSRYLRAKFVKLPRPRIFAFGLKALLHG
jgi:hypothetical protein